MPTITLNGCAPIPLAHYLKALGVLRLVAEQADPSAVGYWHNEHFRLRSSLDREAFLEFFLNRYQPTPIVAPWNGGSGFYEGDDRSAIEAICRSSASRLDTSKRAIQTILTWPQLGPTKQRMIRMLRTLRKEAKASEGKTAKELEKLIKEFVIALHAVERKPGRVRLKILAFDIEQIEEMDVAASQPSKKALSGLLKAGKKVRTAFKKCHRASGKELLVMLARSSLSDAVIPSIDAMVPMLSEGMVAYPPLFGSGGTDGRLEFTNTFLQCLCEIIQAQSGLPSAESAAWLKASLFQETMSGPLSKAPIGQFFPGAAGGANAKSGFSGDSIVNPWDYVLMMEGGMLFAGAAVKKLDSSGDGSMVCPFCVSHSGAGFASATRSDETKAGCEIWTPLWEQPTTFAELQTVFTGLGGDGKPRTDHRHAHIFCEANGPRDAITHVTIWAPMEFDAAACLALRRLNKVWGHGGHDIRLVLHGLGQPGDFKDCALFGKARVWRSLTPFVSTRHAKTFRDGRPKIDTRGWQVGSGAHDLLRLLALHPHGTAATIKQFDERERPLQFGSRRLRSLEFQTIRREGGGKRGNSSGNAFTITFPEPVSGPLALGYGSHFGLGLFVPAANDGNIA